MMRPSGKSPYKSAPFKLPKINTKKKVAEVKKKASEPNPRTLGSFDPRVEFGSMMDDIPASRSGEPKKEKKIDDVAPGSVIPSNVEAVLKEGKILLTDQVVGVGNYRQVKVGLIDNKRWAIPVSKQIGSYDEGDLKHEFDMLAKIHESQIPDHKFIVGIHSEHMAMELCQGTLSNMMTTQVTRSPERINLSRLYMTYFKQILRAVAILHQLGIAHRDIKPQNILIGPDNTIRVCDFTDAARVDQKGTAPPFGTPGYRAPESKGDLPYAALPATDIWSLGILLTDMLGIRDAEPAKEGQPEPHDRNSARHLLHFMLRPAASRYSISQVLAHPFIQNLVESAPDVIDEATQHWANHKRLGPEFHADHTAE